MNLPNLITIGRIVLVPVTVWLILTRAYDLAFLAFLVAGASDAVDGFLARRLKMRSSLGAHLDPIADKLLLVSVYVALAILQELPAWLVILVVGRDVLIVGAVLLSWVIAKPLVIKPLFVSKANTAMQIIFIVGMLGGLAFGLNSATMRHTGEILVAILTVLSGGAYLMEWLGHMGNERETGRG